MVVTKRELRERYREKGIMFKKSHSVATHLNILSSYNNPLSFFWPIIFKCVPLTLPFLLLNKKIKEIVLQYYTGCMAFLYFYIGRSGSKCRFYPDWKYIDPPDISERPIELSLGHKWVTTKYTSNDIVFEGMSPNDGIRDKIFDLFFRSYDYIHSFPRKLIGHLISLLTEKSAEWGMKYFSQDIKIFMYFIGKFPQLINCEIQSYRTSVPLDIAIRWYFTPSYERLDYDEDEAMTFIKRLIFMGADISTITSNAIQSNICFHKSNVRKVGALLDLGAYKSQAFMVKVAFDLIENLEHIVRMCIRTIYGEDIRAVKNMYGLIERFFDLGFNFKLNVGYGSKSFMDSFWNINHDKLC